MILFSSKTIKKRFQKLYTELNKYAKNELLIGMEDTGHYNFTLESSLLAEGYKVALINPITTKNLRKATLKSVKSDKEDALLITKALSDKDYYRIISIRDEKSFLVLTLSLIRSQIDELDKKIEELAITQNSSITTIPGISTISGTSILAELGDISKYSNAGKLIKFAGVNPYISESGKFSADKTAITKKGSKYLRTTLYRVILPVNTS